MCVGEDMNENNGVDGEGGGCVKGSVVGLY